MKIVENNLFNYSNLKDLNKFNGYREKGSARLHFDCNRVYQNQINMIYVWLEENKHIAIFEYDMNRKHRKVMWNFMECYTEHKYTKDELDLIVDYYFELNQMERPIKGKKCKSKIETISKESEKILILNRGGIGQISDFN